MKRSVLLSTVLLLAGFDAALPAQNLPTFRTDPRPVFSIGEVDGDAPYLLSGVSNALRLADGRIVLGNCGSAELRVYSATGKHIKTTGGRGVGPGEFQRLTRIFRAGGDTIGAYDAYPAARVSLFTGDGIYARGFPSRIDVIGRLADGTFVGRAYASLAGPREPGMIQRPATLYRINPAGVVNDSLPKLPGYVNIREPGNPGIPRVLRLHRIPKSAVFPDRIVFGIQDEAVYSEYGPDLRLLRRNASVGKAELVTDAIKRQWIETSAVMMPAGGVLPVYSSQYATVMPAFGDMVAGGGGRLWLQDPYRPGSYPLLWTAYQNGKPVARVELPPRFFPTDHGSDWVLGVAYDDLNVERVQLFNLRLGSLSNRQLPPRDAEPPSQPRCGAWTSR